MYKIMTPGPTMVRENVRLSRSLETTNPDLDPDFYDEYQAVCKLISSLLDTENETLILSGEGILGLEAACASFTEPGDRVLVIDNGIYGRGFADFVHIYGGNPVFYTADYKNTLDPNALNDFLKQDHQFKYATLVHCDTPSGMLNDIARICPVLKSYGILTVVDSVSGMFGEEVHVSDSQIDLLCGGSQKAVSAPPGLTFVTVSPEAFSAMKNRKTPIASFYANLLAFDGYYEKKWFPYTMPVSDIYGLRTAFENIRKDPEMLSRHAKIGKATRKAITAAGLNLHLKSGFSNTVTVFDVPSALKAADILEAMKQDHKIMLAGSFGALEGQVIRLGHMGENCTVSNMKEVFTALDQVFKKLGYPLCASLLKEFEKNL